MRNRTLTAALLCVLAAGLTLTGPGAAQAGDCNSDVILFTLPGVQNPATGAHHIVPLIHSGVAGCAMNDVGVSMDTHYIYPGSTLWNIRLTTGVSSGGQTATMSGIVNGSYGMILRDGAVPGSFYAETGWRPWDPTAIGSQRACVLGFSCNSYRTIDR
jgi:hypothetical protein